MSRNLLKIARFLVVLSLLFGAEFASATPQWCETLVAPEKSTRPVTDDSADFIGYLGQLLENQVIGTEDLAKLQASLERGTLLNPISEQDAQLHSRLLIHRDGLRERIERTQVDPARVMTWVRGQLSERNRVRVRRDETREKTQDPYQKVIFHRIEPGKFQMGESGQYVEVTLSKPFDLMSTPVTQRHWSIIMGENPSEFKDSSASVDMVINDNSIKMQPDHPVEYVSWDDVQTYIQKLNDLSQTGDPLLAALIPDHRKGDQYRLPTEAEWEFVVKNRGRANDRYSFGDREEDLEEYAWFGDNSNRATHPVAELKPLMVDGKAFYDLHGNVWEWVQDNWREGLPCGEASTDPTGPEAGSSRVLRGGSWTSRPRNCWSSQRYDLSPDYRSGDIGFRLARISRD